MATRAMESPLKMVVPFNRWRSETCRLLHTTSLLAHTEAGTSSAVEADTDTFRSSVAMHLEELMRRLDSGNIQLIDVREPHEIEETGSIATSINIPIMQLKSALLMTDAEFLDKFDVRKPRPNDANMVFYGLSAVESAPAVEIAHELGFQWAQHYVGGWMEWSINCRSLVH